MIGVGSTGPTGPEDERERRDLPSANTNPPAAPARPLTPAEDRAYWLAFSLVPGLGPAGFAHLLRRYGSAAAAWQAGDRALAELPRLPASALPMYRQMHRTGADRVAQRLVAGTRSAGGRVVTALDPGYPPALGALEPRPPVLHVVGDDAAFRIRSVAIVGTRRATGYGLASATEIADELARAGVVVSGLAIGIDGAAHRACTSAGGRSVAVLPSPLDRIYPPRHAALAREIVRLGGALVTELPIGAAVGRPDFARRNRIIAALAEAVVVVEAPDRSGALLTATAATAIGRELYAVPGQMDAVASRGCNRLIADQQATIVTSPAALLQQIGLARGQQPPVVASLSDAEGRLLAHLLRQSGSLEELVDRPI
ncbi:MAG: DNA-processing protein DprA [Candidatus Limnocylindria bacterium]